MKTVKATRFQASLKLLVGIVIATCVFTAAANAHPAFAGKFTLPYEVRWGQTVLPAGAYFIEMDSTSAPAVVRSISGSLAVYTQSPSTADSEGDDMYLTITTQGNERKVRSMNLPGLGKSLIFAPLTKSERESLAKAGQIKTVPVVTAQK